jgi:hypothetical protein
MVVMSVSAAPPAASQPVVAVPPPAPIVAPMMVPGFTPAVIAPLSSTIAPIERGSSLPVSAPMTSQVQPSQALPVPPSAVYAAPPVGALPTPTVPTPAITEPTQPGELLKTKDELAREVAEFMTQGFVSRH